MAGSRTSPGLKDERSITQERQKYRAPVRELFAEHERGANRARGRHRPNPSTHPSRSSLPAQKGTPSRQGSNAGRRTSSHPFSAPRKSSFAKSQSRPESRDVRESQESNRTALLDSTAGGSVTQEFSSQRSRGRSPDFRHRESLPRRDTWNRSKGHQSQQDKILDPDLHRPRSSGDRSYENRENSQRQMQHLSPSPHRQNFTPDSASQRSLSPQHSQQGYHNQGHSSFVSPRRGGDMDKTGSDSAAIKSRHSSPSLRSNPFMKRESHNVSSDNQQNSGSSTKHNTINTKPDFDMRDAPTGPRADRQNSSFHASYLGTSEPSSPYSNGRVGRNKHNGGDSGPLFDYSSSNRSPNHSNSSQRGSFHRAAYHDRRHASQGSSGFNASSAHRGRGNFNSHQWVPKGPRDQEGHDRSPNFPDQSGSNTPQYQDSQMNERSTLDTRQDDRSRFSDDMKKDATQDQSNVDNGNTQAMPPPPRESGGASSTPAKESGKFSFAFKAKTNPPPATKPVPDLAQRMQTREPPRGPAPRPSEPAPRNRLSGPPPPSKYKQDYRHDRRERDRDNYRGRGRDDRRDFPARNARDGRRDDHRFDSRDMWRRDDPRSDFRHERRKDRSPEPKRQKRLVQRVKPRQILAEEYRDSDSVYFRKPGDESVIGAGTYGKVFKAIHVYTQDKVALKRIRMEGEKDGFPVTAVREIKLLQHLRHHNVVSLLEVMVEKNECFMVFEYLSHDLTGLINHPTFTLTPAHKKDLAKQMFDGLAYLHHRGVLHRDIKAANILISNRGQLKYADFGLARFFSKSRQLDYTNRVITIWYRPPELLLGDTRYGPAVDVWSAACVFMEMFTKKAVFPGDGKELSQLDKLYSILGTPTRAEWPGIVDMPWVELMGPTERKKRVFEDTYREFLSPDALDLMCQIFQYDPAKRPTADEVLAHAYFATEEPGPQQATELENIEGDWHEFESKALRKEREREAREARKDRDREKEKEKRRASTGPPQENERDSKRLRQEDDSVQQQG